MNTSWFRRLVAILGLIFVLFFCAIVVPAFIKSPDIVAAFAGGFVNPFASGYSFDVVMCWCLLTVWVAYEAKEKGVKHGWVAVALGVVPGVAAGFAFYLLVRSRSEA